MKLLKSSSLLFVIGLLLGLNLLAIATDYKFGTLTQVADKYGTDKGGLSQI